MYVLLKGAKFQYSTEHCSNATSLILQRTRNNMWHTSHKNFDLLTCSVIYKKTEMCKNQSTI